MNLDRRTLLRTTGLAGAASALPARSAAASAAPGVGAGTEAALVVFERAGDVGRLEKFDVEFHAFEVLPIAFARLTETQREAVAALDAVRSVEPNRELAWHNDDARAVTGASEVQDGSGLSGEGYTGTAAHTAVIDSGVDGSHPDLQAAVENHYRYVNPLSETSETTWVAADGADTDDNGHGTHTSGSVAGDGSASDGQFRGMAPDASLTVYSAGATLLVVKAVAAFDHLLATHADDVQVVSNSYGISSTHEFNPDGALERATYKAFDRGVLPVFSAGNSGPDPDTLNDYAKAPHVLGVAATDDSTAVTDFSSRGRKPGHEDGEGAQFDRRESLGNLREYFEALAAGEPYAWDDQSVVQKTTRTGTVGAGVHDPALGAEDVVEQRAVEEWTAPPNDEADEAAGFVEAELAWTPPGSDVDLVLREGAADGEGPVVASAASLSQPETLRAEVEAGRTYTFEVVPYQNVAAQYTLDVRARMERTADFDDAVFGIYRPGVGAPGQAVVSTMNPADPLRAASPAYGGSGDKPYYGTLSGTSMSCPVTAGIATLVNDAHAQEHGEFPDPEMVLLLLEATAAETGADRFEIGAGFVDAQAAVEAVVAGDVEATIESASGDEGNRDASGDDGGRGENGGSGRASPTDGATVNGPESLPPGAYRLW